MKFLKIIFGLLLFLAIALIVGGFLLPNQAQVERSITINKSPENVFTIVNDLSQFQQWSPWHEMDTQMVYTYEGPEKGVGSKMFWTSEVPSVGSGSQEITESIVDEKVAIALDFGQQGTALAEIFIEPQSDGSNVTWKMISDAQGSLIGKYFNLILDSMVGPMYEQGLGKLKTLVETQN